VNALWATLRGGQRQPWFFWVAAFAGSLLVVLYGLGKGFAASWADLLLLAGALVSGIGYAEGTRLGREIGTTVLACWAPIAALPLALALCAGHLPAHPGQVSLAAWSALLYNALFSAFVGMVFWYRGMAKGGIARIAQLQLAQPFVTLLFSIVLLGERPAWGDWLAAAGVVGCIALAQLGARRGAPASASAIPGNALAAR
ncbi:MAG TPA: DMT family transporter, partial [Candidatus Methylacidiphilales bacterium]